MESPTIIAAPAGLQWHPWLHAWAILTVLATLCLLTLGSLVTTLRVGMIDDVGWRTPWHVLTISWKEQQFGYLVEHCHRLAGHIVGICTIGLAVGTWFIEKRTWVRVLGIAALLGVGSQGVLGAMRVNENLQWGTELRIAHGSTAPLVFALLCCIALVTSRAWCRPAGQGEIGRRLRRAGVVLAVAVYLQVVFGAILRHTDYSPAALRLHLLMAMVVVALATWLILLVRAEGWGQPALKRLLYLLKGLLVLQLLLGVETWLRRFREGLFPGVHSELTRGEVALRTLHHLGGLLLFATTVTIAVWLYRWVVEKGTARREGRLEGAA